MTTIIGAAWNVQLAVITSEEVFDWLDQNVEASYQSAWGLNYRQILVPYRAIDLTADRLRITEPDSETVYTLDTMLNCHCDAFLIRHGDGATALG